MSEADFYIDEAPQRPPERKRAPRPLQGRWWKYGLLFSVIQLGLWIMLGFRWNPQFSVVYAFAAGRLVWGSFVFFSFLPFVSARLGFRAMRWFTFVGTLMAMAAYYLLSLYEPTHRVPLLPFITYLQFATSGVLLGFLWEFGHWVYRKVMK